MSARVWVNSLLIAALLALAGGAQAHAARSTAAPGPSVVGDAQGVTVTWQTPPVALTTSDGTLTVAVEGYARTSAPGALDLPVSSVLLALPAGAAPTLQVEVVTESIQAQAGALATVRQPEGVLTDASGTVLGGALAAATRADSFAPNVVELTPAGIARGVTLARLSFYPVRPGAGGLVVTRQARVRVSYNAPAAAAATGDALDPFLRALQRTVSNPEQISAPPERAAQLAGGGPGAGSLAVEVDQPGITQLTYAALAAAGFPVNSVNPSQLKLTRDGAEVALEWEGDGDASFEAGERLLFYAAPRFSRWTTTDVYWLAASAGNGLRMGSRTGSPTGLSAGKPWVTQVIEENHLYTPECYCGLTPAGRDGDRWAWGALHRPGQETESFIGSLSAVDTATSATLTAWLIGYTDRPANPDHHVDVSFNGLGLGSLEWNGRQAITGTWALPGGTLVEGQNGLELNLPGLPGVSPEGAWLDAYQVRYALTTSATGPAVIFTGDSAPRAYTVGLTSASGVRAYDITDPAAPLRLTSPNLSGGLVSVGDDGSGGRAYVVAAAGGVRSPTRLRPFVALATSGLSSVDYLFITHPDFLPALGALAALRQNQGLATATENVLAIYDNYGDGRLDPAAIRAYLAAAYTAWTPTYVLLVGDGTADPRHYQAGSGATYLPPYLAEVDPWAGETAADNRYVTVDGDDQLPDMLIGRLPVNSLAEAYTVTNKVFNYEANGAAGPWRTLVSVIADDADSAGDFPAEAEQNAALVTAPRTVERIYYEPPGNTVADVRTGVQARWAAGAGLMLYSGHASIHQWGAENFLHLNDVAGFANGGRLPVLLQMTCFTGMFQDPGLAGLDETLLRRSGGGAVAVWSSTGLGLATGHAALAEGFLNALAANDPLTVGAGALAGKLNLAAEAPGYADLLDTFGLLGDPATQLTLTTTAWQTMWLPLIHR
ncbi:MAG: hypothetical protein IT317_24225 [Anaerolineales bacterium]|nr:hypothetical protein [Anaerolineales bacterium]